MSDLTHLLPLAELAAASPDRLQTVPGPLPGMDGWRVRGGDMAVKLPVELGASGTIAVWLYNPAPILNGQNVERGDATFFEIAGLVTGSLWWYGGYCQFNFKFADGPNHEIQLPGVPGPQWIHFCYCWDTDSGLLQAYVNGTPTRLEMTEVPPWKTATASTAVLHASDWAMADLRVGQWPLSCLDVEALVPPIYRGALDHLLGARAMGTLAWRDDADALIYRNPLATAADVAGWRMEGPGVVTFADGWMELASSTPDSPGNDGHIVYWCDRDFPGDFQLEFDCQMLSEYGLCITFFCAKGCQGEDLFDPALKERTGIFGHYTNSDIDCYHCSWYANTPSVPGRCTSNLRKNSGFHLVDQGAIGIAPGCREVHRIAIRKEGARIEVAVDERVVLRWHDPGDRYGPILGPGKIGFRQMKWMQARYRDLRVYSHDRSPA